VAQKDRRDATRASQVQRQKALGPRGIGVVFQFLWETWPTFRPEPALRARVHGQGKA
jgi:hypothetical protein